jgi:hypothetical protein
MKIYKPIIIALILCVAAVVIMLELPIRKHLGETSDDVQLAADQSKILVDGSATNMPLDVSENTNNAEGVFRTIIDPTTGQYAIVSLDKQTVTSKDRYGNTIWSTNAVEAAIGVVSSNGIIQSVEVFSNDVVTHIGRTIVILDKETGKSKGAIRY